MHSRIPLLVLVLSLLSASFLQISSGDEQAQPVGVCYGTFADNQPSAQDAVSLVQSVGIQRMRLYGPDHNALQSLRNTGIQVVLGVPNEQLQSIASSQDNAKQWIQDNVQNYQDVNFRFIVVGNGITPVHDQTSQFAQFVLPAMQNIQNAINAFGLQNRMRVTTALDQSEIISTTYQPSQGQFRPETRQFVDPIIQFLVNNNNSPLLVNLHPFFSLIHVKAEIPMDLEAQAHRDPGRSARLDYATFRSAQTTVQDGPLTYTNVFDSMVDSVHSALEKAGGSSLDVVVSEIGWPTAGDNAANMDNARTHNNGLINHVRSFGTPKRPQKRIETYIFNLFDENKKDQEVDRHWGIFWNNKQAKYDINFQQ
ncbi:glucan endo-1,3-beta-glucosidase, acidic-like [Apium graveolens]|uniref:glucan endo-1,3-beta-glucosidase, acidic-like n=1 Tax=Apium graveolens TaxID=4045 RepID=UPI003D78D422